VKTVLDYKKDFLCVLTESEISDGPRGAVLVKEWHPIHKAEEAEVRTLVGRPVTEVDTDEGIYIGEEGNVFQLVEKGRSKSMEVEQFAREQEPAGDDAQTSADGRASKEDKPLEGAASDNHNGKVRKERTPNKKRKRHSAHAGSANGLGAHIEDGATREDTIFAAPMFAQLSLRQKLAVVRRRIAYVQKRGHNERKSYNYVTAADIAGAVGDILAELGVVVVPRLESISHEPARTSRSEVEHLARVVMAYTFMDVDTAEEITVKVAGEGLDAGDKAPYKAMTGALKYALLQSFLLATGDDPENDSAQSHYVRSSQPRTVTEQETKAIYELVEKTGTELERVLEYYKVSSVAEMTEATYHRAMETLGKKLALMERKVSNNGQG
jgi:ERF superfamily